MFFSLTFEPETLETQSSL